MITFKTFLLEDSRITPIGNQTDFIELVRSNCKNFIAANKSSLEKQTFLFRGVFNESPDMFIEVPRKDRRPTNTPYELHQLFDEFFEKTFGFKYRSGGVFTTQKQLAAKNYGSGNPYIIFPAGDYNMCSSDEIFDLYDLTETPSVELEFYYDSKNDNFHDKVYDFEIYLGKLIDEKADTKLLFDVLNKAKYHESKSYKDFKTSSEIMVKCSKFYAILPFIDDDKQSKSFKLRWNSKLTLPETFLKDIIE